MKQLKNFRNKFNKYVLKTYATTAALFLMFAIPTIIIAIFANKIFEVIFLFIAFVLTRYCFPKTFHSTKYKCILYSIMMFSGMIYVVIPVKISLIFSVFVATFTSYVLFLIKDYSDMKIKRDKNLIELTDEEFIERCQSKGLTPQETMIADCIFRKCLKGENLYAKIGYSKRQTINIKKKILNKLNSK